MREILFRGKREDNGEWVYGYYLQERACSVIQHIIVDKNGEYYRINPKTRGEYTGLNDINDKKIFEGDIVNWGCGMYVTIKYVKEYVRFAGVDGNSVFPLEDTERRKRVEIIGNIHENSASLNKKLSVI